MKFHKDFLKLWLQLSHIPLSEGGMLEKAKYGVWS